MILFFIAQYLWASPDFSQKEDPMEQQLSLHLDFDGVRLPASDEPESPETKTDMEEI